MNARIFAVMGGLQNEDWLWGWKLLVLQMCVLFCNGLGDEKFFRQSIENREFIWYNFYVWGRKAIYRKVHIPVKISAYNKLRFLVIFCSIAEGRQRLFHTLSPPLWLWSLRPSTTGRRCDSSPGADWAVCRTERPCLCRRDALRLTLADIVTLVLCLKEQRLQDNTTEEGSHQVLAPAGIQHCNVDLLLLGENPSLILDLLIVPSQPVDALTVE